MLPKYRQHVAGNKQLVARNMLLVRATCCLATCCAGVNAALDCLCGGCRSPGQQQRRHGGRTYRPII